MVAVRYLVKDVDRSIAFYTKYLGFKLDMRPGPAFAIQLEDPDGNPIELFQPASD
jgi:catechol 2,3-dioxygenase-like lactoylglutathione lyase family enzyme